MDVVGHAAPEESRRLGVHLRECEVCRGEEQELEAAVGALRLVAPASVSDLGIDPVASSRSGSRRGTRRRSVRSIGIGAMAAVAVAVAVALFRGPAPPASPDSSVTMVALRGTSGVEATLALSARNWGTLATLRESGEAPGQVLTVSMRSESGRWWVAGSYRTTTPGRPVEVQFACGLPEGQITDVWVSDKAGGTVLSGYVG
jgi:hypothetical protein